MTDQLHTQKNISAPGSPLTRHQRIGVVVSLLLLAAGFPFSILNISPGIGTQISCLLIAMGVVVSLWWTIRNRLKINYWELGILLFVCYCIFVAFLASTFIFHQGVRSWLGAQYVLVPLLIALPYKFLKISIADIADAFVILAVFGALLVTVDHFYNLSFLDAYQRGSAIDIGMRRIVLLNTEMTFAMVICFARFLAFLKDNRRYMYGAYFFIIGYALLVISEKRLAILASLLGCAIYLFFMYKGRAKKVIITTVLAIGVLIFPIILGKYIIYLDKIGDLATNDLSARYRIIELFHFYGYFKETHGIGFGLMSAGINSDTILSFSNFAVGYLYGAPGYTAGVADLSLAGALFQFGYIGLLLALIMTFLVVRKLWRMGRHTGVYRLEYGVFSATILGFFISPLPMNFFTLDWSMRYGGLIWFVAAIAKVPEYAKDKYQQTDK